MSSSLSRLQKFVKPLEIKSQTKVSSDMDDFWKDCFDTPKINENEIKRTTIITTNNNNNSAQNISPDKNPEEYITCIIFF